MSTNPRWKSLAVAALLCAVLATPATAATAPHATAISGWQQAWHWLAALALPGRPTDAPVALPNLDHGCGVDPFGQPLCNAKGAAIDSHTCSLDSAGHPVC